MVGVSSGEGALTHIGADGRARMVDVAGKPETVREAVAEGRLRMSAATLALALAGGGAKGDVRAVAELAGVMAAKRTSDLIPLCHPLPLSSARVEVRPSEDESGLTVTAVTRVTGRTGVEMEALTACTVSLLTLYDMLKAVERGMVIEEVRLLSKTGGASGEWTAG